jgi:hypothetical protein
MRFAQAVQRQIMHAGPLLSGGYFSPDERGDTSDETQVRATFDERICRSVYVTLCGPGPLEDLLGKGGAKKQKRSDVLFFQWVSLKSNQNFMSLVQPTTGMLGRTSSRSLAPFHYGGCPAPRYAHFKC